MVLGYYSTTLQPLGFCVRLLQATRRLHDMLAVTQPPVMQHWIVALKHISIPVYGLLAFASEAFWEMEIFGNLRYIPHRHLMCVAWTMLISHWFFFASGIGSVVYEYVIGSFETKQPKPTSSKVDKTKSLQLSVSNVVIDSQACQV